jgi:hypothetical protein
MIKRSPIIGVIRKLINYYVLGTCNMGGEVLGVCLMEGFYITLSFVKIYQNKKQEER